MSLAVLAMAVVVMAGCQKEELTVGDGVHFATTLKMAGGGTKALDSLGHKTFAVGDRVAVVYQNTSGNTVKAVSGALTEDDISSSGKVANFSVMLDNPDNTKQVTYIYPASMAKNDGSVNYDALKTQDGTLTTLASDLDLCTYTGSWSDGNLPTNVQMTNQLVICSFKIKDGDMTNTVTSSVTRFTVKHGTDIYTVIPSSLDEIWVALKPVTSGDITFYSAQGKDLYKKTVSGKTLAAGNIYPIILNTYRVEGAVSGLFSIDESGDLYYFSKGNLQATYGGGSWSWGFATNQYDYIGNNSGNTSVANTSPYIENNGTVDLFGWSTSSTYFGIHYSSSEGTYVGDFVDWGTNVGTANQWHTMTGGEGGYDNSEWEYLLKIRSASTVGGTADARYAKVKVNGICGVMLFPDNYTHPDGIAVPTGINDPQSSNWGGCNYTIAEWGQIEAAGAVFLPAAGLRIGQTVVVEGDGRYDGRYWSSTSFGEYTADCLLFWTDGLKHEGPQRYFGHSVRLVGK